MLTLPTKFQTELNKAVNTPSFLVKLEDGTLYNEQTLGADWEANSQNSQIDYLAQEGSVLVESTLRPENLITTHKLLLAAGDLPCQSFKQYTGITKQLQQIKSFFSASVGANVYCALYAADKTTQIGTTIGPIALTVLAGEVLSFDFSSQALNISNNTTYWFKFWSSHNIYYYYNPIDVYSGGQFDVVKTNIGDLYFQVSMGGFYKPSGYIRTQTMDIGSTPAEAGEWVLEDIKPTGTDITYEAWSSATGAFAGEETGPFAIADGDPITDLKRYYRVKATLTANGDQSVSPTLQSIKADFTTFKTYSDNPSLGHETAILSVSSLSSSIDTFKPSTIGQITFSLNLSPSVSNYLATKKPKNKLVQVKAGFVADGFLEADYIDYSWGQIDDWKITAKDEVTLTVKDFSKEWDVDVPKAITGQPLPTITWGTPGLEHPIDVMLDILKNHINARDSKILGSSFGTAKAALPDWRVSRTLKEDTVSAKDLMEELRLLTQAYFLPQANGKIKIKRWEADEAPIDTLTDADFISKRWDSDAKQIINRYVHFYGWDGEGDEAADYNTVSIGIDTDSQTDWRETTSKELKDKWTPQTQTTQVADFLDRIMKRYANPPSILQAEVDLRKIALEVGDIVTVSTSRAPSTDMTGISNIKFQIINRNLDYSKRTLSLTMLECASSVNTQVEPPVAQETPYDLPDHVDELAIVEQEYINKDSSYTPLIVVTYELPANATYWSHALIQTSIDGGLTYKDYGLDYLNGNGFIIDASQVGGFVGGTFEVRVISVNIQGIQSPSATAPTASLDKIGEGTVLTAPPSAPRGLTIEGNPDPNNTQWDGLRFGLTWWKASQTGGAGNEGGLGAGGFTDPYWNGDEYELWVGGSCIDKGITKEARYDYVYGDGFLDFLDDKIAAANGTVTFKIRRVSLNQPSDWSTITITQAAPVNPVGLASNFEGRNLVLTWTKATETDFKYYELILNGVTKKLTDPFYTYTFEENVKDNTTADPSITYSLKVYDIYGNDSGALTGTFPNAVPGNPQTITAQGIMKGAQFDWSKNTESDFRGYSIRTKIAAEDWSSWKEITENSFTRMLTDAEIATSSNGALIYIEVKTVDSFGQISSASSANVAAKPVDAGDFDTTAPVTPIGLSLATGVSQGADGSEYSWIRATWTANTESDLQGYEYRIKEDAGNYIYGIVGINEMLFSPVRANILHYMGIRAFDKLGNKSNWTADSSATSAKDATAPAPPSNVTATGGIQYCLVTWDAVAISDLSHYEVYRNTANDSGTAVKIAEPRTTYFIDGDRTGGQIYYYWLKTKDSSGNVSVSFSTVTSATPRNVQTNDVEVIAANKILVDGTVYLSNWRKTGDVTKIDGGQLSTTSVIAKTITVQDGNSLETVNSNAANGQTIYTDPGARINAAAATKINPGEILISGSTYLSDWRMGGDLTKINGGNISANTVTANKLIIGSRGLSIQGLEISANKPVADTLYWTAGVISYTKDDGTTADVSITGSNILWTSGTIYLYWVKDGTSLSTTTDRATAFGLDNVVMATYRGGTDLVVNYGRTIVDGSDIVTGTITADRLNVTTLSSIQASTGTLNINSGGYINGVKTSYADTAAGFYLGNDSGTPKFNIGDATKYMKWDGAALTIRGSLNADDIVAGSINVNWSGGNVRSGQTAYATGTGFWLGNDGGTPKFSIGDATKYLKWDGATLSVAGSITITGGSGIANLTDAGDLAVQDSVVWQTQVGGTGKPADNADITASQFTNTLATIDAQTDKVEVGLNSSGDVIRRVIPGTNIGTPAGAGLYLGADYMGYYDSLRWSTYMDNQGKVAFKPKAWKAGAAININEVRTPTTENNYSYKCTTAGTTGGSEPTWPTIIGNTVNDNGTIWTCQSKRGFSWDNLEFDFRGRLNADDIVAGSIRGIGVYGSTHATKGSYLTATCAASDTTLYVKDTTDFPSSGSGWIIDSANDRDAISWTGKTATTLTGCSGVLAHTVSASNVPVVVSAQDSLGNPAKTMVMADVVNELRFFGDRGDGTVENLVLLGINPGGYNEILTLGSLSTSLLPLYVLTKSNVGIRIQSSENLALACDGSGTETAQFNQNRHSRGTGNGSQTSTLYINPTYAGNTLVSHFLIGGRLNFAGPPTDNNYRWLAGEVVFDSNYKAWICYVTGTPGSWKALGT